VFEERDKNSVHTHQGFFANQYYFRTAQGARSEVPEIEAERRGFKLDFLKRPPNMRIRRKFRRRRKSAEKCGRRKRRRISEILSRKKIG